MSNDLLSLADRVQGLTGPCRETDAKIKLAFAAQLFLHNATKDEAVQILGGDLYADPLRYTGSYDAAITLKADNCTFALGDCNDSDIAWACVTDIFGADYAATGANPILAFVSANLRAHAASESNHE